MMRTTKLAILTIVLGVSSASADIAPPPKGIVHSVSPVRVLGINDCPDYVFFFRYYTSSRGNPHSEPPRLAKLQDGEVIQLFGAPRFAGESILAVPRATYDKHKAAPNLQWLRDGVPGTLTVDVRGLRHVAAKEPRKLPVVEYRVALKDGNLLAELLTKDPPEAQPQASTREDSPGTTKEEGTRSYWLLPLMAGLFAALSLATYGVWFARRRVNNRR